MSITAAVFAAGFLFFLFLVMESKNQRKHRRTLKHVIHVNGTRGKSSVTRLIAAGLVGGGIPTYCKTTGTIPMVIDTKGKETPIPRRGPANIKEQLWVLGNAARDNAQVLVVECMALHPEYQYTSQHSMLEADIGVITNVRLDHTEIMGETTEEIAQVLSLSIPKKGTFFTADKEIFPQLQQISEEINTTAFLSSYTREEAEEYQPINFPENVALALRVCEFVGVDRKSALEGMSQYKPDPYALSLYRLDAGGLAIGGLAINDSQSILQVYSGISKEYQLEERQLILLINNRSDRATRTKQMAGVIRLIRPDKLWILGTGQHLLTRIVKKEMGENTPPITYFPKAEDVDFSLVREKYVLFATGNIAGQGESFMKKVEEEGTRLVQ